MEFSTIQMCCLGSFLVLFGIYFVWIAFKVFVLGIPHVDVIYRLTIFIASISDKEKAKQYEENVNSEKIVKFNATMSGIGGALFIVMGLWNLFSVLLQ